MAERTSLGAAITECLQQWIADNGGGFPIAAVVALNFLKEDGGNALIVAKMPDQSLPASLGLSTFLDQWFRDEATSISYGSNENGA